jgi:tRNA dimethylallyltransferase
MVEPATPREFIGIEPGARLLALVGPTAVGKTAVALKIATELCAEIISADSMQIYRGMDIGTSKPSAEERHGVPIHMLDIADPDTNFSVAHFKQVADHEASHVIERCMLPLLVGGSGLYYRAIVDDLDFANVGGTDEFRVEIEEELSEMSEDELHGLLADLDPGAAEEIPPANRRRVLKAIEVAQRGGRLMSERQASWSDFSSPYDLKVVGLDMERRLLYRMIDGRVDSMMDTGLAEEVARLMKVGLRRGTTAGEALGYRQLLEYFEGLVTLEKAVEEIKARTRQYAKRQLTWFRKDPRVRWFRIEGMPEDSPSKIALSLERTAREILEFLSDKPEN